MPCGCAFSGKKVINQNVQQPKSAQGETLELLQFCLCTATTGAYNSTSVSSKSAVLAIHCIIESFLGGCYSMLAFRFTACSLELDHRVFSSTTLFIACVELQHCYQWRACENELCRCVLTLGI